MQNAKLSERLRVDFNCKLKVANGKFRNCVAVINSNLFYSNKSTMFIARHINDAIVTMMPVL